MQLILNTWGASLHVRTGVFEVVSNDGRQTFSPSKVTSLLLGPGCRISSDAALLALKHEIAILFTDRQGQPQGRVWSPRYGSISTIRRKQVAFAQSAPGAEWVVGGIVAKLNHQMGLLAKIKQGRPSQADIIEPAILKITLSARQIAEGLPYTLPADADRLRGLEGVAARAYFEALAQLLPKEFSFKNRSKRPAKDKFNCVLNYLYGMLYSYVEGALIKAGLDPYMGVLHMDEYNRPTLVFDAIEPYRAWADAVTVQLCVRKLLDDELFDIEPSNGNHWLNTVGKKLIIPAFNDYMHEVVDRNHRRRSRLTHLQDDAHALAQDILKLPMDGDGPPDTFSAASPDHSPADSPPPLNDQQPQS